MLCALGTGVSTPFHDDLPPVVDIIDQGERISRVPSELEMFDDNVDM